MSNQPSTSRYSLLDFGRHETTGPQHVDNSNSDFRYQYNICGNNNAVSLEIPNSRLLDQFIELEVPRPSLVFEGREGVIKQLDKLFFNEEKRKVVVTGLAGCGKTELAKRYAQHAMKNGKIKKAFWVAAETIPDQIFTDLKLSFKTSDTCLYVFDNAKTLTSVSKYLPPDENNFLVLVTSQYEWWGDCWAIVKLEPVSRDTSRKIFQIFLGNEHYERIDKNEIEKVIEYVSDIPLGLVVVAGHLRDEMEGENFDIEYFKNMLRSKMLDKDIESAVDSSYSKSLSAAIFDMVNTMNRRKEAENKTRLKGPEEKENKMTNMLLCVCAYLDPDKIPTEVIKQILGMFENTDSHLIEKCLRIVKKFSFFDKLEGHDMLGFPLNYFKIHRMCQDILMKYYSEIFKEEEIKDHCYNKCLEWALQNTDGRWYKHHLAIFRHTDRNERVIFKMTRNYYTSVFTDLPNINYQSPHYQNLVRILQHLARHGCVEYLTTFLNEINEINRKKILDETRLLHEAAKATQGQPYETVRYLLDADSDVHVKDKDGRTALHWAAGNTLADTVTLLLEEDVRAVAGDGGTSPQATDYSGLLLEKGSRIRRVTSADGTVSHLLEIRSAADNPGWTALHGAACGRHAAAVKLLLEKGSDVHVKDKGGRTALHWAAENGHADAVKLLLTECSDVHAADNGGWTALLLAALNGHADVVKLLLEGGSNVRAADNGWTALHLAAGHGHADVVKLLLEGGSDVRAVDGDGMIALHRAAENGHADVVKLLLEGRSDVGAVTRTGWTALHWAAVHGHADVVKLLLDGGSNISALNGEGSTALHCAALHGHADVVKLLLEKGSDVHAVKKTSATALMLAAVTGSADVVKLLLDGGSNIHAVNRVGWTPLHGAARFGRADVVSLLLNHGADVNVRDPRGCTALEVALIHGADVNTLDRSVCTAHELELISRQKHAEVARILQEHGAGSQ